MARSRMYFARSGVVIGGYYAAYGFASPERAARALETRDCN
jgi:hypothetical protein